MRKILLIILAIIVAGFITIQFFQPEKNQSEVTTDAIFFQMQVPETVKKYLVDGCYDCHSNQTRYPWYSRVAPFSWWIGKHISEGKEQLNFSSWSDYSKRKQLGLLNDICEVCEDGSMPLKSYIILHKNAELFDHEIEEICAWAETAAEDILNN